MGDEERVRCTAHSGLEVEVQAMSGRLDRMDDRMGKIETKLDRLPTWATFAGTAMGMVIGYLFALVRVSVS